MLCSEAGSPRPHSLTSQALKHLQGMHVSMSVHISVANATPQHLAVFTTTHERGSETASNRESARESASERGRERERGAERNGARHTLAHPHTPSPVLDTCDARLSSVIVFVLGGATYEEAARVAAMNASGTGAHIILGGTAILNSHS